MSNKVSEKMLQLLTLIRTLIHDPPCTGSLKWPIFIAQTATHTMEITYIHQSNNCHTPTS